MSLAIQPKPVNMNSGRPGMPNINNWPNMGERPNNLGNVTDLRSLLLALLNGGIGGGLLGGIGSSLLGIGSTFLTNKMNQKWAEQQQQAAWAKEQQFADQAYRRQLQLIEKYQTPSAIKNMLKEAGLSPGLMYSKGGAGTVGTGSTAKGNAGMGAVPMMSNPLSMMAETLQLSKLKLEMDNIKADTQKKLSESENVKESTTNLEIINRNLQEQIDEGIANLKSDTDKNRAQEILLQTQNYYQELENMFKEATFWTEVEGKIQETENLKKLGQKLEAEINEIAASINNLNADSKLKNALMQKAMSEMLLANQHILTASFERSFAKMKAPTEFFTLRAKYRQELQNLFSMELDNARKEFETTPFKLQWDWWTSRIMGIITDATNAVGTVYQGVGIYKYSSAKKVGQDIKNVSDKMDLDVKIDQKKPKKPLGIYKKPKY